MKKKITYFILLILLSAFLYAQLGDYVVKFDPRLAVTVYEKELSESGDDRITLSLARLYDQLGDISPADSCYRHYCLADPSLNKEYMDFLLRHEFYQRLRERAGQDSLDTEMAGQYIAESWFMEGNFEKALRVAENYSSFEARQLGTLAREGMALQYRSPALGGLMSVVLPGSGKVYAGRWLDGVQALVMIATPAVNSYYHFKKYGVKSVRAWVWGGSAAWLYFSDIYGAVKAVKQYNEKLRQSVIRKLNR